MTKNLPAYLAGRKSLVRTVTEEFGLVLPPRISIRGSRFTMINAGGELLPLETLHLDCIILDMSDQYVRHYYAGGFNDAERLPPTCFSDNGVAPSSRASQPQSARCDSCNWSKWGSDVSAKTGKGIPACQQRIKLAVLVVSVDARNTTVTPIANGPYRLEVPPASLTRFKNYCKVISSHADTDLFDIVTRVTFDPKQVGTFVFRPLAAVPDEVKAVFYGWPVGTTDTYVGRDDEPYTGEIDPEALMPPSRGQIAAPAEPIRPLTPAPQPQGQRVGDYPFLPIQKQAASQPVAQPTEFKMPVQPATVEAPAKRGRPAGARNKPKEAAPAPTSAPFLPAPAAKEEDEMPAFLQRPLPAQPAAPAPAPAPSFGMQSSAPVPNADLMATLDRAMGLKT